MLCLVGMGVKAHNEVQVRLPFCRLPNRHCYRGHIKEQLSRSCLSNTGYKESMESLRRPGHLKMSGGTCVVAVPNKARLPRATAR